MSKFILEGILAAREGATVYRKADQQEMMVVGVACSYIDKYGTRKEEVVRFIELAKQADDTGSDLVAMNGAGSTTVSNPPLKSTPPTIEGKP